MLTSDRNRDRAPRPAATPLSDPVRVLVDAVQRLSMARTLADVQEVARSAARRLTRADGATFVLRERDLCYYADEDAIAPLWKGKRFPIDTCISGWTMLHRRPAVIEDIYADERIPHDAYRPTFVQSLAMVPIRSQNPIGAIGNYWADHHPATEEELELLQALADSTAVAMENVRVFGELEQRVAARTTELEARARELREAHAGVAALLAETQERAEDLKDSAEARKRLVHALAHEVRNPLAASDMLLQMALDRQLPKELQYELTNARQGIADALHVVSDQLASAQLEAGAIRPRRERVDVPELFDALRGAAHVLRRDDGVRMVFECAEDLPDLHTDPRLLGQILRNLLGNALKFTDAGEIRVVASAEPGDRVSFAVVDSGIGIPPEEIERVFAEFGQVDGAQAGRRDGTGLGLPLSRELAERLGGKLEVMSEPGRGSVFTVLLPRR